MKAFLIIIYVLFISCINESTPETDIQTTLLPRDEFFIVPDTKRHSINLRGKVKELMCIIDGDKTNFLYDNNGYWQEIQYYNKEGNWTGGETFQKSHNGIPYREINYDINLLNGSYLAADTFYYEINMDNRTVGYEFFGLNLTGHFDEYGNEVKVVYEDIGYDSTIYDRFGKPLEATFYEGIVAVEKKVYNYDENGDITNIIRTLEKRKNIIEIVSDTLVFNNYSEYDSKGNWTKNAVKKIIYSSTNGENNDYYVNRTYERKFIYF